MGWVAGPAVLFAFSFITYFTSTLLADCYRSPDPVHGKRNYTYSEVVKANLGGGHVRTTLTGVEVGVDVSGIEKVWRMFQAIGDIAFAYAFSNVLIEIQASNIYLIN
ncbi:hypothetical protein V8G54_037753 [Vigna mungo]|uniref:Amino acid transporter transmembrane domain-containing protein n=1 Tax=Vigna mungo TaxID=3915 RepID=A0AAQ3MJR2_VIGMU